VPSTSGYRVVVSAGVKRLLERLAAEDRVACRRLALLLLRLEKNREPEGSRPLDARAGRAGHDGRVWRYDDFLIAYIVNAKRRLVEVGIVKRR
jgi:hypothetical protein